MKGFAALLLLAVFAEAINGQRATRGPPPTRSSVTRTSAPGPTRQQAPAGRPSPRPSPSRASTSRRPQPGPTRQQNAMPPMPERSPQAPPIPTRDPLPDAGNPVPPQPIRPVVPPMPTRPGDAAPQDPNFPIQWPIPPADPIFVIPTGPPNVGRPTPRPPRISVSGVQDNRCPAVNPPGRVPVQLPHQSNCERFYKCDNGVAFEYQCPIGQHWNAKRNYCDFPNLANCGENNQWNPNQQNQWNNNQNQWNNNQNQWNKNQNQWNDANNNNRVPDFQNPINIPLQPGK